MRKYFGEIGLFVTAIIWGSGFVAASLSLDHYTPYQNMAVRFMVGALILSFIFYKKWKAIRKEMVVKGVLLGSILYLAFALQTVGLQFTTPSKNAFLTAVNVVIVPFIGLALYKKRLDKYELAGAVLAMAGIGFLSLKLSWEINFGDFLSLLCAFAFAFHIFYTARFVKDGDPIVLTIIQMWTAAALGFAVILFQGEVAMPIADEAMLSLLYLGVFSTALCFLLQTAAQKFISETKAAIILSTESFWGMIFSILILGEVITLKMAAGAALILLAIMISETKPRLFKARPLREKI
jgi:drug/metabolite transporter (DMT)-like permease